MAKARVTRRGFVSIPQLEHFVAILAVNISVLVKKELDVEELTEGNFRDQHFYESHNQVRKWFQMKMGSLILNGRCR